MLRAIQYYFQSDRSLHSFQSQDGIGSSGVERQKLVEKVGENSYSVSTNVWERFQANTIREMRAAKEKLAITSNPSELSTDQLERHGDLIRTAAPTAESTAKNYDNYWNNFMKFCSERELTFPPTESHVYSWLVSMFVKTPSGQNCRNAFSAIVMRSKKFDWDVSSERITDLLVSMNKVSPISKEIPRDPWNISYINKFISVGLRHLDRRTFIKYMCIMILGIRTMLRGSELGGILSENVTIIRKNNLDGLRIVVKKVKNDSKRKKKGRTIEIEATDSVRCPLGWVKMWLPFVKGQQFFFGEKLSTEQISGVLRSVATWIGVKGHFASHSLRIGGASEAAFAGFSHTAIQALGDWSSNAIDRYFRAGFSSDKNVSDQMGL